MRINNKSVQGIFLYTENSSQIEFEKNDFVVSGDCIYICTAENPTNTTNGTVSGIDPVTDTKNENFKPYPGSRMITADEFFKYIEEAGDDGVEDKYISAQALVGILQRYNFGMSMTGTIHDYIKTDGTNMVLGYQTDMPLDDLMLTESLNNGTIYVDPELSQIQNGLTYNGIEFSTLFGYSTSPRGFSYNLVLRQYTYESSSTTTTRVQELVNPFAGITVYRYLTWTSGNFPVSMASASAWRSSYSYGSSIRDKLTALEEFYQASQTQWASKYNALKGTFKFIKVPLTDETSFIVSGDGMYTVTIQEPISGGSNYYTSRSASIYVKVTSVGTPVTVYFPGSSSYLTIRNTTVTLGGTAGAKIIDVYGRKEYEQ